MVFATLYIFSLLGLVVNLLSDLTYTWIDPRIDFETRDLQRDGAGVLWERFSWRSPPSAPSAPPLPRQGWLAADAAGSERRLANFKANRRGYWSFWIFMVLFVLCLCAEFIANDRPIMVRYKGETLFPVAVDYPEEKFGGFLAQHRLLRPGHREGDRGKRLGPVGRRSASPATRSTSTCRPPRRRRRPGC